MTDNQTWGITRERALSLMQERLTTPAMQGHSLASEAIMRALAPRFNEAADKWGLAGLLHDLDYNETKDRMETHGLETARILEEEGVHHDIIDAIKRHNAENLGLRREAPIDFALTAGETITGMIVATTLVYPDKKLTSVKPQSVKKRMKAKEFARSVNRNHIRLCEEIGIPLDEFIKISLEAMTGIANRLGL